MVKRWIAFALLVFILLGLITTSISDYAAKRSFLEQYNKAKQEFLINYSDPEAEQYLLAYENPRENCDELPAYADILLMQLAYIRPEERLTEEQTNKIFSSEILAELDKVAYSSGESDEIRLHRESLNQELAAYLKDEIPFLAKLKDISNFSAGVIREECILVSFKSTENIGYLYSFVRKGVAKYVGYQDNKGQQFSVDNLNNTIVSKLDFAQHPATHENLTKVEHWMFNQYLLAGKVPDQNEPYTIRFIREYLGQKHIYFYGFISIIILLSSFIIILYIKCTKRNGKQRENNEVGYRGPSSDCFFKIPPLEPFYDKEGKK